MIRYDDFFSRTGMDLRESAIRRMGSIIAPGTDVVSFAPGYPAEDTFAWPALRAIAVELLAGSDGAVLQYGPTRGFRPLREAIAGIMRSRDVSTTVDQTIVTTGSQQGLDLVARVLLDRGDVVLVERPSYTGAISAFRNVGASMVGVTLDDDGVEIEALDETWRRQTRDGHRVKALYVVPNFQNPTGALMSLTRRLEVLAWAARRNVLIIEDDPYRDLYFEDVTVAADTRPIAADDEDQRVIYLSSFSKTLAPGFRVAWVTAADAIVAKIELAKQAGDLCTGVFDQRVVHEACHRGVLDAALPGLRAKYQHKRDVMTQAIDAHLGGHVSWRAPRGGFFLWLHLEGGLHASTVLPIAHQHGVLFVAGTAFHVDDDGDAHMRLSFSAPSAERISIGIARLGAAIVEASTRALIER